MKSSKHGLRVPAREKPNMEKALFNWPIVLQYDVKAKYRLISREFSSMTFFHQSVRLTNQTPRAFGFVPDKPIKLLYISIRLLFLFCLRVLFQGHTKIALCITNVSSTHLELEEIVQ